MSDDDECECGHVRDEHNPGGRECNVGLDEKYVCPCIAFELKR